MRKKSKYIRKSDVITVWKCPGCKDIAKTTIAGMADGGTPFCSECEGFYDFSHVLVPRPRLKRLVVTNRGSDVHVHVRNEGIWSAHKSFYEAVGDLVVHHPEEFGLHPKCRYVNFSQKID